MTSEEKTLLEEQKKIALLSSEEAEADPMSSPEAFLTKTLETTKEMGYEQSIARIISACYQCDTLKSICEDKSISAIALFHKTIGKKQ